MANNVLRTLLVRLGVSVTPTTKADVDAFNAKVEQVKQTMRDAVTWTHRLALGLATMAAAGAAAMLGLTNETGRHASEIENQAKLLLLTRREYQEWLHVTERVGATSRDLADAFIQINDGAQRAIAGEKAMAENFQKIGITAKQLKGLNPGQIFELMATHIEKAADKSAALSVASQLLGEEAVRQFGPALMQGTAAIRAMRKEAEELGLVMSDDQLRATKAVSAEWTRLRGVLRGLRNTIVAALAPVLLQVLRGISDWVRANRELIAQRLEDTIRRIGLALESVHRLVQLVGGWDVVFLNVATGLGMLTLLANLDKVKGLLTAADILFKGLGVVGGAVATALGIPLAVLVGIIAGLVFFVGLFALALEDAWVWLQGGNSLIGQNLDLLESWIPAFGAVRDLFWALAQGAMVSWRNVGRFATALREGLKPALEIIDVLLQPLLDKFEQLWKWWEKLNDRATRGIEGVTSFVQRLTDVGDRMGQNLAPQLQGAVAGSVSAGVARTSGAVQAVSNRSVTENINQVNTFIGANARDVAEGVNAWSESARRKARAGATLGGPR